MSFSDFEKQLGQLSDRLEYMRDVFGGKHRDELAILDGRLQRLLSDPETSKEEVESLSDLFFFVECKLEDKLTPMDKVRIARHPHRVCLRDILENVYDSYTEIGGHDEHNNDPAMVIARASITRRQNGNVYHQPVMVIGHEKGHGEEFRNGGAAKPWGNAKAQNYMQVAETEGIPIHTYIFTPGGDPVEEFPGAAQQIAKNIYELAGLRTPVVAVFSEGGSGGAEALALADMRLMFSHGYYSVISPEGAAAIEGHLKRGERAAPQLTEKCALSLKITAEDNVQAGYIDRMIQEPVLGARPYHFEFFRSVRQEVIRATDEIVLQARGFSPFRGKMLRQLSDREINLDETYVRWELTPGQLDQLVEKRQDKFLKFSRDSCTDSRNFFGRLSEAWSEQWWEIYNRLFYDMYERRKRGLSNAVQEVKAEASTFQKVISKPWNRIYTRITRREAPSVEELTRLSEWDRTKEHRGWNWVSDKAAEDRAVSCPNAAQKGCMDLWAPDLYNEFAGVCINCGHHFPMEYKWFMHNCFDEGSLFEFNSEIESADPLRFPDFGERLKKAKEKTGLKSSCITFEAMVENTGVVVAILTASFRGGSVGAAEGTKLIAAIDRARRKRYPCIIYCHGTAGIRIQEGINGLIQMPRVTVAVRRYIDQGGLYLVIYDTKSYGGPVASFLGCSPYQFAIRSSSIGFAGPAVIKNTTGVDVAPDYHSCFNALTRGQIQGVWDRRDLRANIRQALLTMGGRNLYYR